MDKKLIEKAFEELKSVSIKIRKTLYGFLNKDISEKQLKQIYWEFEGYLREREIIDGDTEDDSGEFNSSLNNEHLQTHQVKEALPSEEEIEKYASDQSQEYSDDEGLQIDISDNIKEGAKWVCDYLSNTTQQECDKCEPIKEGSFYLGTGCPDCKKAFRVVTQQERPKEEYEYEMFFTDKSEFFSINGWFPIATDAIKNPNNIDKYIAKGLLRKIKDSEQLKQVEEDITILTTTTDCPYQPDNTTGMNCIHCGQGKYMHVNQLHE